MKIAQLLPLIVLPAMGNTEVCPIAVNPTERGICTILTTKWVQEIRIVCPIDSKNAERGICTILTIKSAQEIRINCQFVVFLLYELKKVP